MVDGSPEPSTRRQPYAGYRDNLKERCWEPARSRTRRALEWNRKLFPVDEATRVALDSLPDAVRPTPAQPASR